jgi:hypothetical protein
MTINLHKAILALTFLAVVSNLIAYQEKPSSIQGTVTDTWGHAVPGA